MKKISLRLISMLVLLCMAVTMFAACTEKEPAATAPSHVHVDYVAEIKLDMDGPTLKQEVEWGKNSHIDGDTSHFVVPKSFDATGKVKARYLAVNTPESTGQIQEWGKAASKFTQEKLSTAHSIIIESDNDKWNHDGNGRYLVWVWYQPTEGAEYRCLNIELLQNGLGAGSSASEGRYGATAVAAINQATQEKLYMFSNEKDPDFPYGAATELTLRELRTNVAEYNGFKVAFEGVITNDHGNTLYVESYDAETDMYYGISVYYGFNFDPFGLQIMKVGNKLRIVGTVSYYEQGGTYQVSGISYNFMDTSNPNNISLIEEGVGAAYVETAPDTFKNGKVTLIARVPVEDSEGEYEEQNVEFDYSYLAMNTSLSMTGLTVKSIYTTTNDESSSKGAMTLTCEKDGVTVAVRTVVLYDADGNLVTADYFEGKVIDVKGVVDYFEGTYQLKVFSINDITIKN